MKITKYCIKRGLIALTRGVNKATSYDVVKSKLSYRWYHDDLLKARQEYVDSINNQTRS